MIRESEIYSSKIKPRLSSRVSGIESAILYLGQLLFESDEEKFSFRSIDG